jgi:hypothetical protein
LWDYVNSPEAWAKNPSIVAVTFTVYQCSIDQMEQAA